LSARQKIMARPLITNLKDLRNIVREENVVELVGWKSIHPTITKPMVTGSSMDIPNSVLSLGPAIIERPEILGSPTHVHPFDQWIYLFGYENFNEFEAYVELTYDDRIIKIDYPAYIFIPKGTKHCPLDVKRVDKPIIFMDISITQEASVRVETQATTARPTYKHVSGNKKPE